MQRLAIEAFLALGGVSMILKLALSNEPTAVHKVLGFLLRIPAVKAFVKAHPDQIKQLLQVGEKAAEEVVDEAVNEAPSNEAPKA